MKMGYLLEGSTDRAVVVGLGRQLCPGAELIEGHFRGSMRGAGRRRELPKACRELAAKGAVAIVNINDANELPWHKRRDQERDWTPEEYRDIVAFGAPEPNINAWLIADANHFRKATGQQCRPRPGDPKPFTETAFRVTGIDRREAEIADFAAEADLAVWAREDNSFGGFMEQCRRVARVRGCELQRR